MPKQVTTQIVKRYSPTPAEMAKVEKLRARMEARPPSPEVKLRMGEGGVLHVMHEHSDPDFAQLLLMADLGADDAAFYSGLTGQIARLGSYKRPVDQEASNFALSVIRGIRRQPRCRT